MSWALFWAPDIPSDRDKCPVLLELTFKYKEPDNKYMHIFL